MNDVKSKALSGLFWTYAERIAAQGISLLITVILARILSTTENGTVSLVLVFITLANVIVSDGFGSALIQKKDADELDFSSMFWFSVFLSIVAYFIIFFCSPLISDFFGIPSLTPIIRVFALRIPVAAVNSIQQAYISKKMEFKKFFFATIIGTILSGVVGITMASYGFGVWSLIFQYLTNSVVDTIILGFTIKWRPSFSFSFVRVKNMIGFAARVLLVQVFIALYSNLRNLIIGKKFTVDDLSFSDKGQHFPSIISVNINTSITKVIFPTLSLYQDDIDKVREMSRRAIKVGTFLLAPVLLGLAAVAPAFISVVLSDKWLPCLPYLRIMCVVYLLQPIQTASLQAMKALGESKLYLRLEIYKWIFGIIVLVISVVCFDTVFAVVMSALVAEIFATVINFPANIKILKYKLKDQLLDFFIPLLAALIMFFVVISIGNVFSSKIITLLIQIFVGIVTYWLVVKLLKIDSYNYVKDIAITLIKGLKSRKERKQSDDTIS